VDSILIITNNKYDTQFSMISQVVCINTIDGI